MIGLALSAFIQRYNGGLGVSESSSWPTDLWARDIPSMQYNLFLNGDFLYGDALELKTFDSRNSDSCILLRYTLTCEAGTQAISEDSKDPFSRIGNSGDMSE